MRWTTMGALALAMLAGCDDQLTNEQDSAEQLEEVDQLELGFKKGSAGAANGDGDYCNGTVLCVAGEGDCDYDYQCSGGTVCGTDNGDQFGFTALVDVCVPPSCDDKVQNGAETGVDCGSPECGDCVITPIDCTTMPANGTTSHCSAACPCPSTESDCDSDAECEAGLDCRSDVGPSYGYPVGYDVCQPFTCSNGALDGDETALDCGGSCGSCSSAVQTVFAIGESAYDRFGGIAVDSSNGQYAIVGQFENTLNLGGNVLVSNGGMDVFVAMYNASGSVLWANSFGSSINDGDGALNVSIDPINHKVAVGGAFVQTVDFGGGGLVANQTDGFVAVYDLNGNHLFSQRYGDVGLDRITDVQYDRSGNLYFSAVYPTSINLGGSTFASAGSTDFAIAKLNASQTHVWSKTFGGTSADVANDIAIDRDYRVLVAGNYQGTVTFGTTALTAVGSSDALLLRLGSTGSVSWVKSYGGTSNDAGLGVAVDQLRRPTLVGYFKRTVDFGGGNVVAAGTSDKTDAFAVAVDASGNYRWARAFGSTDHDQGVSVSIDPGSNDVVYTGYFKGTMTNYTSASVTAAGGTDIFLTRLVSTTGATLRAETYGNTADDTGKCVGFYNGDAYVSGDFNSATLNLGAFTLNNVGSRDIWFARVRML